MDSDMIQQCVEAVREAAHNIIDDDILSVCVNTEVKSRFEDHWCLHVTKIRIKIDKKKGGRHSRNVELTIENGLHTTFYASGRDHEHLNTEFKRSEVIERAEDVIYNEGRSSFVDVNVSR